MSTDSIANRSGARIFIRTDRNATDRVGLGAPSAAQRNEPRSRPEALVSVVIPTRNRPELVERAVRSAQAQSLRDIEIIVVIDGPDAETEDALRRLKDERLRILKLPQNVGGSEARNIGARFARATWIAFLDDDDEWFPEKLAKQWKAAEAMQGRHAFVASQFIERGEDAERLLPLRMPAPGESFSDYMFARRGWNSGEGFLQTSTWLMSRALISRVPFTSGLKRCQDLDWLLHATALPELNFAILPEPLAIFHHDERPGRVSRTTDWRFLYEWALANRAYFTPRAFSFFIATFCVPSAAKQQEGVLTLLSLLRSCIFGGEASAKCLLLFLICWCLPEQQRRMCRSRLDRFRAALLEEFSSVLRQPAATKAV